MKCPYCDEKTIFHVHTYRCKHASQEREEEYVKKALSLGSTKLVFTDHAPFPENPFQNRMAIEELPEYISVLQRLKEKYKGVLDIQIGLEIEYIPDYRNYYQKLKENVDILLLGQHFSLLPDKRYTFMEIDKNIELYALAEGMIAGMETGFFEAVSHPDRIFRRIKNWNTEMEKIATEIKECASSREIILEQNISNMLKQKKQEYRPEFWETVPFELQILYGVDAHSVNDMEKYYHIQKVLQDNDKKVWRKS